MGNFGLSIKCTSQWYQDYQIHRNSLLAFWPYKAYKTLIDENRTTDSASSRAPFRPRPMLYPAVTVVVTVTVNWPTTLVTGITVNGADVTLGAAGAGAPVEFAPPSSLCVWWRWYDSVSEIDGAAEDCAAGKSVVEADADAWALSVNEAVGLGPKEAESVEEAGEAVSDGWNAALEVTEAIELLVRVFVMVG